MFDAVATVRFCRSDYFGTKRNKPKTINLFNLNNKVMANNKNEKLFSEFPEISTEQWEAVITTDLKGADYQKKLVWRTAEGFNVRPYYRAEDLKGIGFLGIKAGQFPYVRGNKLCGGWKIFQSLTVECPEKANAEALKAIEAGAESIGFGFEYDKELSVAQIETLLSGIDPTKTELMFCACGQKWIVEPVMNWAASFDKAAVRIAFNFDPIIWSLSMFGKFTCGCSKGTPCFESIAELVKKYSEFKHVRFVGVDASQFGNSGSTIVEELAFMLSAAHDCVVNLMEAGLTAAQAAKTIRFTTSITSNYFMEIAKLRAARMLWANIMKAYDPQCCCAEKMYIHAVTSSWNMTVYDPYVNMLRGTTEAMSAALGGVHSMEVTPFNAAYANPTEFSHRIARNVQLLLKKESHFDNVVDAAGGSYYIENLTQSIADAAWALFKQVEDMGGYIKAFEQGFITSKIEESAAAKDKNIATRRLALLGSNQYPNFNEKADKSITDAAVHPCTCECVDQNAPHLKPYRGAMPFEQLRLTVERSGKEPKAFMLTCGQLAMARARAQFSCNFFAVAGIKVIDNTFFASVEDGVAEALKSGAEIVVVCSSDDDYATVAPEVKRLIDNKAIVVVAGAPACQSELEAAGINHFISIKNNVLQTLTNYVKELGIIK